MRKLLGVLVLLVLAGCSGVAGEPVPTATSSAATSATTAHENRMGEQVPGPAGSTLTFLDYQANLTSGSVSTSLYSIALVQVCASQVPAGGIPVNRARWSLVGHGKEYPAIQAKVKEPSYPVDGKIYSGDCVRGWVPFAIGMDSSPLEFLRYSNVLDGQPMHIDFRIP